MHRSARVAALGLCVLLVAVLVPVGPVVADDDGASAWVPPAGPDVLLVISDDQTLDQFTPELMPQTFARIVAEGTSFSRAYVSTSLCCPARAQIMTGRTEPHSGVDSTAGGDLVQPTILDAAHDVGYRTVLSGKFLNNLPCADRPEIDSWLCTSEDRYTLVDPDLSLDGAPFVKTPGWTGELLADHLASEIAATPADRPLLAVFSPPSPHQPANDLRYEGLDPGLEPLPAELQAETRFTGAPPFRQRPPFSAGEAAQLEAGRVRAARSVRALDDDVATVLDAMGSRLDDALVIFISDNGFAFGERRMVGKQGPYEEQVHVPLVVRWPGVVPAGLTRGRLASNVDIAHTVAAAIGVPWTGDGIDLVGLAQTGSPARTELLLSFCHGAGRCRTPARQRLWQPDPALDPVVTAFVPGWIGVVTPTWKYVEHDTGEVELFDLVNDPLELDDRSDDPALAGIRADLASRTVALSRLEVLDTALHWAPSTTIDERVVPVRYSARSRTSAIRCRTYPTGSTPPAWEPCPASHDVLGPLADGSWTFDVAAADHPVSDGAGARRDSTPASTTFIVAAGVPPAIASTPERWVPVGGSTELRLADTAPAGRCRTREITADGRFGPGAWTPCTPWTAGGLVGPDTEGTWVLEAQLLDGGLAPVSGVAAALYTVDRTGPRVVYEQRPAIVHASSEGVVRFRFDEDVLRVPTCTLDGVPVSCHDRVAALSGMADGAHAFVVRAVDRAGNVRNSGLPFTIEHDGPPVVLDPVPAALAVDAPSPVITFSTPAATDDVQCSIDGEPWAVCVSPLPTATWLRANGPHVVRVRAVDRAGNAGPEARATVVRAGTAPDCGDRYPDVGAGSPFCGHIAWLVDRAITSGYSDGTFRPTASVSRQALASWLHRLEGPHDEPTGGTFSDVDADHPFAHEIGWLAGSGLASGYADGTFRPTAAISRQALVALLRRRVGSPAPGPTAPTFVDVPPGHPFEADIRWAAEVGLVNGYADGTFRPIAPVSRQAAAAILQRDAATTT